MKKLTVLLLLLTLGAAVFADDALVLPKGVLRTYLTGAFAFASSAWDKDGTKQDLANSSYRVINAGAAVEFGILDWITAAVQWAPGYNVWTSFYKAPAPFDKATVNGPYDIFAGAKIQVLGEKAPIANEKMRLAFAPGVKIPLPAPDFAKENENQVAGKSWVISSPVKHTLGVGARAYFDYVLNKMFYINLYGEFIYYPMTVKIDRLDWPDWAAVQAMLQPNYDVAFGYDLTVEAEPHFEMMLGEGIRLGIGVPVTFYTAPELKLSGTAKANTGLYVLSVGPNVSVFLLKSPLPVELELGYTLPLLGKNVDATNTLLLQVKLYLKFY